MAIALAKLSLSKISLQNIEKEWINVERRKSTAHARIDKFVTYV